MKLECVSCGQELKPAGDNWGVWRCENRACNRYAKNFIPRPIQTPFVRKRNRFAKKRTLA